MLTPKKEATIGVNHVISRGYNALIARSMVITKCSAIRERGSRVRSTMPRLQRMMLTILYRLLAFNAVNGREKTKWFLDTGCSNHMCGHKDLFAELNESITSEITFGNAAKMPVNGKGKISIKLKEGENNSISDVYYVPAANEVAEPLHRRVTSTGSVISWSDLKCERQRGDQYAKMAIKSQIFTGLAMASTPASSFQVSSSSPTTLSMVRRSLTTSFFNAGVGALKVEVIRVTPSYKRHSFRQCGGALGAHMNLFGRIARVLKSYANAIISSFEDPEKIVEQAVLEMNDDLTKMRQATAQVLGSQKRLENKYKAAQQASEDWYQRAQLALQKGEEDLAREALKRRKSFADNAKSLKTQLDQQKIVVDNLVSNTKLLESKIQEARSKKDTLKARAQSAKTASQVSEMVGNVNTSSALSAFEKMEEKVLAMESEAEALGQLTIDDLEAKFVMLESSSVDDDLANLKKELSGSSKKGELPPGRTVDPSYKAYPFKDFEIEKELNELRRKAKDF
ncbi:hypothetical protein ACLB2K_004329 [Fragaria x ananassa]